MGGRMAIASIGVLILCIVGGLAALSIQAGFLLWGAKLVKIENSSFFSALCTTVLGGIAALASMLLFQAAQLPAEVLIIISYYFFSALIMVPFFSTTYGKAFGAMLIACVIGLVFWFLAFALFLKIFLGL